MNFSKTLVSGLLLTHSQDAPIGRLLIRRKSGMKSGNYTTISCVIMIL